MLPMFCFSWRLDWRTFMIHVCIHAWFSHELKIYVCNHFFVSFLSKMFYFSLVILTVHIWYMKRCSTITYPIQFWHWQKEEFWKSYNCICLFLVGITNKVNLKSPRWLLFLITTDVNYFYLKSLIIFCWFSYLLTCGNMHAFKW